MVDAQCFALFGDLIVQCKSCGKQGVVPCRTRVVRQLRTMTLRFEALPQ
jgi:hypothetical protein